MLNTIQFPIKGTYYYAADLALESNWIDHNAQLTLIAEPDNPYDKNAIQVWCDNPDKNQTNKLLLGYVPRALAKQLSPYLKIYLKNSYPLHTQVIHRAKSGKSIEIDCQIQLNLSWLRAIKIQWLCFWIRLKSQFKNRYNQHT
jgi:hypothetical protein